MRKRIACGLLALMMFFSLFSGLATPVAAASDLSSSEDVIEFIKKFEGFSATAFWDVNQWSIGYGTTGQKGQTITEEEADVAMRDHLAEIDQKINEFAAKYDLNFDQYQHDALASFSFNVGTSWMKTSGRFRSALINGCSLNEFLFCISLWANVDSVPERGILKRRLCEANLFFNGEYTKAMPDTYSYVIFDANGGIPGTGGEDKMQGYLLTSGSEILVGDPTKSGQKFLGWFTQRFGGEEVTYLDESTALMTLYAHFDGDDAQEDADDYSTVVATGRVVCDTYVNIRKGPGTGYAMAGQAVNGTKVTLYEIRTVGAMDWGKTQSGWISLDYVRLDDQDEPDAPSDEDEEDEPEDEPEEEPEQDSGEPGVVVNANVVNVRKAAGTSKPIVTTLKLGTKVLVYEQTTKDNAPWGRINQGWICMNYVRLNSDDNEEDPSDEPIDSGRVSSNTNLNVRSGPGTDYSRVNFLTPGTRISVYEVRTAKGERWGRIGDGRWVCLTYVTMNSDPEKDEDDDPDDEDSYTAWVNRNTALNVRSGPGTDYGRVKTLSAGTAVTVYEETERQGMLWGRIGEKSWICLSYVTRNYNDEDSDDSYGTGKVISKTVLNVRSGPGTGYGIVTWLNPGTRVTILEKKTSGGLTWGRIQNGWVCMTYIQIDS